MASRIISGRRGEDGTALQPRGGLQQFCHLLFREDVRLESLMRLGKQGGIRNEAAGLGPAPIEAEVVHLLHSDAPHTGSNMLLGLTPGLEGSRIQDGVLGSVALEKSVQRFESASLGVEALAQGTLQIHITLQGGCKRRRERSHCSGHRFSSFTMVLATWNRKRHFT